MSEQPLNSFDARIEPEERGERPALGEEEPGGIRPFSVLLVAGTFLVTASLVIGGWMIGASGGRHHHKLASKASRTLVALKTTVGALSKPGDPQHGRELFGMTCIACHGPSGAGIPNLGANLRESKFVAGKTDSQLVEFVKKGRQPGEPGSVLGLMMPPKGGNPALDDASLHDIVAFIRSLQTDAKESLAGAQ